MVVESGSETVAWFVESEKKIVEGIDKPEIYNRLKLLKCYIVLYGV